MLRYGSCLIVLLLASLAGCGQTQKKDSPAEGTEAVEIPKTKLPALDIKGVKAVVGKQGEVSRPKGDKIVASLEDIEKELAPVRVAFEAGDIEKAASLATPELLKKVEAAQQAAGELAKDEGAKEEEKDFWGKLADILMTILRIVFFLVEIFGKGGDGKNPDPGPGRDSGKPGRVMVAAPKDVTLQGGKPALVGDAKGRHLVNMEGGGTSRRLVVALDKQPDRTFRLKLPNKAEGVLKVSQLEAGKGDKTFPIKASCVIGGKEVGLRWDSESAQASVTFGSLDK